MKVPISKLLTSAVVFSLMMLSVVSLAQTNPSSATLTREEQVEALSSEIALRKAAINEIEAKLASAKGNTGMVAKVAISVSSLTAISLWMIPTRLMPLGGKGVFSGLLAMHFLTGMHAFNVSKEELPLLEKQLVAAKEYVALKEARLAEISR